MYTGVLPISIANGQIYILLGMEKYVPGWRDSNLWDAFGGKLDPGEDARTGAAREFYEESMGAIVYSVEQAKSLLHNKLRVDIGLGQGWMYLFPMSYDPEIQGVFNRSYSYFREFIKSTENNCGLTLVNGEINASEEGFFEKTTIDWWKIDDIDILYEDWVAKEKTTPIIRPYFLQNWLEIREAIVKYYR